jgi:hypothetical protein
VLPLVTVTLSVTRRDRHPFPAQDRGHPFGRPRLLGRIRDSGERLKRDRVDHIVGKRAVWNWRPRAAEATGCAARQDQTGLIQCSLFVLFDMDQNFRIVQVEANRDELVATAGNFQVARAAYDTAVSLWPKNLIELRQGARVVLKSQE